MPVDTANRRAARVTVGLGAGIPRIFKDVNVVTDHTQGIVELWSTGDFAQHVATAPLSATLIEWEVAPAPKHKITLGDDAPRALSA